MCIFRRFWSLGSRVARLWALSRHTPPTMAQYLRKRGAEVGEECFIVPTDLDLSIDPQRIRIGNHVAIAAGVRFLDEQSAYFGSSGKATSADSIVIENNCFIGLRSVIYPGVRIGPNAVVGAGSVVLSDVPPNSVVMGVPARPFGSLERYREKCLKHWVEQRPSGIGIEAGATWWTTRQFVRNRELLKQHLLKTFQKQLQ